MKRILLLLAAFFLCVPAMADDTCQAQAVHPTPPAASALAYTAFFGPVYSPEGWGTAVAVEFKRGKLSLLPVVSYAPLVEARCEGCSPPFNMMSSSHYYAQPPPPVFGTLVEHKKRELSYMLLFSYEFGK